MLPYVFDVEWNGLEVLSRADCVLLLADAQLGRLAVTMSALPHIVPVNFVLDGNSILIRTGTGTKLDAATRDAVVAFEVDDLRPSDRSGWSVCVVGLAGEITDPVELERIGTLALPRWSPNGESHVIAVSMEIVTGRRVSFGYLSRRD